LIPKSFKSASFESRVIGISVETNILVDPSLLQMFKETKAELETFEKLKVKWVDLDKDEIEKPIVLGSDLCPIKPMLLVVLESCMRPDAVRKIMDN
jgi:hypothetical protein